MARARVELALATSGGGHLELLQAVEAAWADRPHVVVTPPGPRAAALARAGHRVETVPDPGRGAPLRAARTVARSLRLALALRPRVVVTPGAGAAVAFCLAARLLGARLVLVETMARVNAPSATGRLLGRFADEVLVQWPELRAAHPRARVCRPALLERDRRPPEGERAGTLVAVGTHGQPFDRLLALADRGVADGLLPAPALAQAGPSAGRYERLRTVAALDPEELERAVAASELVVCHGGAGIVALAVRAGHRPLVLPRRAALGEHVDDHQRATVAKLAALGLVVSLDDHPLAEAVELARRPAPPRALEGEPLAGALRAAIAAGAAR